MSCYTLVHIAGLELDRATKMRPRTCVVTQVCGGMPDTRDAHVYSASFVQGRYALLLNERRDERQAYRFIREAGVVSIGVFCGFRPPSPTDLRMSGCVSSHNS